MSKKPYRELNDLVSSYEDKTIDNNFVFNAFEIMKASEPKLKEFLTDIHVGISPVAFAKGNYHYSTKHLSIYLNEFTTPYVTEAQRLDACITMISHLIEHARSYKKFLSNDDDIESHVTKPCFNFDPITNTVNPGDCSEGKKPLTASLYSPIERIASIRAAEFFVNLIKYRKDPESLENARNILADVYIRGYINNGYFLNPPTYNYLIERKEPDALQELDKIVTTGNFDLYTRVLCGLPIKMEEINTIEQDFARVKLYLNDNK